MSKTYVDNNILQRALFCISDLMQNTVELASSTDYDPADPQPKNIIKLTNTSFKDKRFPNATQYKSPLVMDEEIKIFRRQQELMSDTVVTSDNLANLLFSNKYTSETIDTQYHITHNIIIFIDGVPFFFNIDTVNYDNKKFFISDLSIKNQSKNVLTFKSDYRINLKIFFTEFDDLLEKSIKVYQVEYPDRHTYIAPLHLLYNYFDRETNQFGKSLSDGNGIYMSQTLKFHNNTDIAKQMLTDVQTSEITKNYHLMYLRHNFEMFKNDEPIFKYFENELNIEYASYESDGQDKKIKTKHVPKGSTNLYNLISSDNFKPDASSFCTINKENIKSYESAVRAIKDLEQNINVQQNKLKQCGEGTVEALNKETIKADIKNIKEQIVNIKKFINSTLTNYILDRLFIFQCKLSPPILGLYETSNFAESLKENFNWVEFGSSIATGAMTSGYVGAAISGGGYAVYNLIAAAMARKIETTNTSLKELRDFVSNTKGCVLPLGRNTYTNKLGVGPFISGKDFDWSSPLSSGWDRLTSIGDTIDRFKFLFGNQETQKEVANQQTRDAAEEAGKISTDDLSGQEVSIYFTTFGELLRLVCSLKEVSDDNVYIIGGYTVDTDISKRDSSYVNFMNIPIYINNIVSFLTKQIMDREGFKYDTDVFLMDCYENLVKNILKDGQIVLDSVKKTTPKLVQAHSTIHADEGMKDGLLPSWIKHINLLDDQEYLEFKKQFLKTKMLNLSSDGIKNKKIFKISTFGTSEEIKYYDFYKSYINWSYYNNNANKRFLYNVVEFQEFINKEHLMPCILMKNVADSESMLKKKYVKFSRIDNANAETGNLINGSGVMRKPYQMSTDLKAYMSFFCDVGSYIFISPPISKLSTNKNMFGFGGLYMTKTSEFNYSFQKIINGNVSIPNLDAKYTIIATNIYHGDSILNKYNITQEEEIKQDICTPLPNGTVDRLTVEAASKVLEVNQNELTRATINASLPGFVVNTVARSLAGENTTVQQTLNSGKKTVE